MKRVIVEPTDAMLIEAMKNDSISRNDELKDFLSLLDTIDGGFTFFIDGSWGSGKTYFVRQAFLTLEYLLGSNQAQEDGSEIGKLFQQLGYSPNVSLKTRLQPVYFNAWNNDSSDDPVIALIASIAIKFQATDMTKIKDSTSKSIVNVLDKFLGLAKLSGVLGAGQAALSGKNVIESYRDAEEARRLLPNMFGSILEDNKAEKLVLFIDELDRCSPSFAVKLLERIKYLFSEENIIVVFSTDESQLSHSISRFYGDGFDGKRYLSRFYDQKLILNEIPPKRYLLGLGLDDDRSEYDQISMQLSASLGHTMRDCLKYYEALDSARRHVRAREVLGEDGLFLVDAIMPALIALKFFNCESYRLATIGQGEQELFSFAAKSNQFLESLSHLVQSKTNRSMLGVHISNPNVPTDRDYFHDYYQVAFNRDTNSLVTSLTKTPIKPDIQQAAHRMIRTINYS